MNYYPVKHPLENFPVEVDFASDTASIATAAVSISVYLGTDPNPAAVLVGALQISGSKVLQRVAAGILGVQYLLRTTCSDGTNTWVDERILPVNGVSAA